MRSDARYAVSRECADLRVRVRARGPCLGKRIRARSGEVGVVRRPGLRFRGRSWSGQVQLVMVGLGLGRDRTSWASQSDVRPNKAKPVVK